MLPLHQSIWNKRHYYVDTHQFKPTFRRVCLKNDYFVLFVMSNTIYQLSHSHFLHLAFNDESGSSARSMPGWWWG